MTANLCAEVILFEVSTKQEAEEREKDRAAIANFLCALQQGCAERICECFETMDQSTLRKAFAQAVRLNDVGPRTKSVMLGFWLEYIVDPRRLGRVRVVGRFPQKN